MSLAGRGSLLMCWFIVFVLNFGVPTCILIFPLFNMYVDINFSSLLAHHLWYKFSCYILFQAIRQLLPLSKHRTLLIDKVLRDSQSR